MYSASWPPPCFFGIIYELALNSHSNNNTENGSLNGIVTPINVRTHAKNYDIAIPYIIKIPEYDAALVKIIIKSNRNTLKKHQLSIHVTTNEEITIPYDMWVSNDSKEWSKKVDSSLSTTVIINNASESKSISLFTDKSEQKIHFNINLK